MPKLNVAFVYKPSWAYRRWWEVAYLIVGPDGWLDRRSAELAEMHPSDQFEQLIGEHVNAFVKAGTMPPEPIASAILNLADDVMAGRPMTLKAGDYIALQGYMRTSGM